MKLNYADKIAPVQADGTVAMFIVRNVAEARFPDPTAVTVATEPGVKKLREKVAAVKVTLSLVVGEGEPYPYIDFIPILTGWIEKFDALRIATGELIASREDFDCDTLIGKQGFLVLTEKDGKNYVGRYLRPEDGETEFTK
jgi:hypothetical protein